MLFRRQSNLYLFHRFLLILCHIFTFTFGNYFAGGFHHILTCAKRFFFCMCFAKYLNLILNFRPDDGIGAESLSPFSLTILAKNKETGMLTIIFLLYILTMSDFMPKTIQTMNNNESALRMRVKLGDCWVAMLVDTGAAVSIIPRDVYESELSHVPLQSTTANLQAYGGSQLTVTVSSRRQWRLRTAAAVRAACTWWTAVRRCSGETFSRVHIFQSNTAQQCAQWCISRRARSGWSVIRMCCHLPFRKPRVCCHLSRGLSTEYSSERVLCLSNRN